MATLMTSPKFYAVDHNGDPLAYGKLYTYESETTTPKVTYTSEDESTPNTNPVILNGEGYADIFLSGQYTFVLRDSDDNDIWSSNSISELGWGFVSSQTEIDAAILAIPEIEQNVTTNAADIATNAAGIATNAATIATLPVQGVIISSDLTITVGATGDFTTINEALAYLSVSIPKHTVASVPALSVTINLLAGFVMQEQVIVSGMNFGYVTITGDDAETSIDYAYLSKTISGYGEPAFCALNGGTAPIIGQLFTMTAGAGITKIGVLTFGAGSNIHTLLFCGVKYSRGIGIFCAQGGNITGAYRTNFSYSVSDAVKCVGGTVNIVEANLINSSGACIRVSGNGTVGVDVVSGYGCQNGIIASSTCRVSAVSGTFGNSAGRNVYATGGAHVSVVNTDCSAISGFGIEVGTGAIVSASGSTGTLSQTVNTITSAGLIIK